MDPLYRDLRVYGNLAIEVQARAVYLEKPVWRMVYVMDQQ